MNRLGSISDDSSQRRQRSLGNLDLNGPPLPHTLLQAMRLVDRSDEPDHQSVVRLANNDPIVAVRLLRLVNSAYYGLASEVHDLDRAVRLLGPSTVAGMVLGMQADRSGEQIKGPAARIFERIMRHSMASSHLAEWLAGELGTDARLAFRTAVMRQLGTTVLVYNYPDDADRLYGGTESPEDWSAAETAAFGCTSREAALYVAEQLEFPDEVTARLGGSVGDDADLVADASELAASAFGFFFPTPLSWEDCADASVWEQLVMRFPARSGEPAELVGRIRAREDEVQRYIFHLFQKRVDRGPIPPNGHGHPPSRQTAP